MKFFKQIISVTVFSVICLTSFVAAQTTANGWKWRFKTLKQISAVQSDEKTVFVTEYNGNAYALNKLSGRKEWELKGGNDSGYSIWLKGNVLIVSGGSGDGKIQAFTADTRRLLWSENLAPNVETFISAVSENSVFRAETYDSLKALDLQTGKQQWINRDCDNVADVRVDGNMLYVLGAGGNLFALDAATGATVWKYKRHGSFELLANGDKALIFSYSNGSGEQFIAIEKTSGKLLWSEKLDDYDGFSAVYEANRLYVTFNNSPSMLAFDTEIGKQIWKIELPETRIEREDYSSGNALETPTVVGDLLYSGGRDGFLYVFEKQTGKRLGKRKIADGDLSSPVVVGETGYVWSYNKLFAVDLKRKDGGALWRFSAYGSIFLLKHEADETLYFQSQENSYNAIDLKSIERLARLKKPLGTRTTPAKNDVDTPVMTMSMGAREKFDGIISAPAFAENAAYFTVTNQTAGQGLLYEVNLRSGALRKVSEIKADELSAPKLLRGRAYFSNAPFDEKSSRKPFLYAVEIGSGKTVVERQIEPTPHRELAPEIVANSIFISGRDSYLYAYDAAGEYRGRISADVILPESRYVSADEKSLYLIRDIGTLSAADFASGNVAWQFRKPKPHESIETLSEPNEQTILVGTHHDALYSLDKTDGRVVWKTAFDDDAVKHITLSANQANAFVVTVADSNRWLQAIRISDGKVLWGKSVGSENPAYLFGEDVCAASAGGFFCFKQADGSRSISYRTDKTFFGFSPEGILLYSTEGESTRRPAALQGVSLREGKILWNINLRTLGKAPTTAPKK